MVKSQKKLVARAGKLVSTIYVDQLIRNYKRERWLQNSLRLGKEDSLSVWYSVEELEEFLSQVKEHGGDGVRVCYGVYDAGIAPKPLYEGRQTVVFVATRQTAEEKDKSLMVSTVRGRSILAYNGGRMCPPFCPTEEGLGISILDKGKEGLIIA